MISVHPDELVDFFDAERTTEDERLMQRSIEAEAEGDPKTALDLYMQTLHIVDAPHERELRDLLALGDGAPSWVINRWVIRQSYLWMLLNRDRRTDTAVCLTLAACYQPDEDIDPAVLYRLGTLVCASDWVSIELATYALGGLTDYVGAVAGERLLSRCSMLRAWAGAPLRPLRYDGQDCGDILVTDLVSGLQRRLLDLGAMNGADAGQHVLGRLVPMEQSPGLMFAERPLRIDEQTAREAADAQPAAPVPGWLSALADAVDDKRLPVAVGLVGGTPLGSDVPYEYGKRSPAA